MRSYSDGPEPGPKPKPADPCSWKVYHGGYNISKIVGAPGNIACVSASTLFAAPLKLMLNLAAWLICAGQQGDNLDKLLADCCKNHKCASVSWIATEAKGCLKPDTAGGWEARGGASSYVPLTRPSLSDTAESSSSCPPAVIVRSARTGLEVRNVLITNATRYAGTIAFQPEYGPGEYHAYYLPHSSKDSGSGFWTVQTTYRPYNASAAEPAWAKQTESAASAAIGLPKAAFIELEPRVEFHRTTDMELIATLAETAEMQTIAHSHTAPYLLFPEERTNALRLTNATDLPVRWAQRGPSTSFNGTARRGEWYIFQIGVWAARSALEITGALFSGSAIPASEWTCINLGKLDALPHPLHRIMLGEQRSSRPLIGCHQVV